LCFTDLLVCFAYDFYGLLEDNVDKEMDPEPMLNPFLFDATA